MICKCGKEIDGNFKNCSACRAKTTATVRKYYNNKKQKGLCTVCTKKAEPGKRTCKAHTGRTTAYGDINVSKGLCRFCGKRPPVDELVSCQICRDYHKKLENNLKISAFENYGGVFCACCGESHQEFLTIDHINNDGAQHRRDEKIINIYRWLKKQNYPEGFRVLCFNCNAAYGLFGYCPHKEH